MLVYKSRGFLFMQENFENKNFPKFGKELLSYVFIHFHFIAFFFLISEIFLKIGLNRLDALFVFVFLFVIVLFVNDKLFPDKYLNELYEKYYYIKSPKLGKIALKLLLYYMILPVILLIIVHSL